MVPMRSSVHWMKKYKIIYEDSCTIVGHNFYVVKDHFWIQQMESEI